MPRPVNTRYSSILLRQSIVELKKYGMDHLILCAKKFYF